MWLQRCLGGSRWEREGKVCHSRRKRWADKWGQAMGRLRCCSKLLGFYLVGNGSIEKFKGRHHEGKERRTVMVTGPGRGQPAQEQQIPVRCRVQQGDSFAHQEIARDVGWKHGLLVPV